MCLNCYVLSNSQSISVMNYLLIKLFAVQHAGNNLALFQLNHAIKLVWGCICGHVVSTVQLTYYCI